MDNLSQSRMTPLTEKWRKVAVALRQERGDSPEYRALCEAIEETEHRYHERKLLFKDLFTHMDLVGNLRKELVRYQNQPAATPPEAVKTALQ